MYRYILQKERYILQKECINPCHTEYIAMPTSNFQPIRLLDPDCKYKFIYWIANSADPDQLASAEANWSGSTLFEKTGYIQVQQDKG